MSRRHRRRGRGGRGVAAVEPLLQRAVAGVGRAALGQAAVGLVPAGPHGLAHEAQRHAWFGLELADGVVGRLEVLVQLVEGACPWAVAPVPGFVSVAYRVLC